MKKCPSLKASEVVRDEGPAHVDLQRGLPHRLVVVVEEVTEDVKDGRLVGDHLLEAGRRVLRLVGRVQKHLLHVIVP